MKAKILLISTRWIHDPRSIFFNAKRCDPNPFLKEYFYKISNEDLKKILSGKQKTQTQQVVTQVSKEKRDIPLNGEKADEIWNLLPLWLQNDSILATLYTNDDYSSFIKQLYNKIKAKIEDKDYEDQVEKCNEIIKEIRPYLEDNQTERKEKELPSFHYSDEKDDFIGCLNCNAVNIDLSASASLTIADRISLYKIMEELYVDEVNNEQTLFKVYSVWPLGNPNKDKNNDKEKDCVFWIDQLTKAIKEECKGIENIELILLLHDNDLASTAKTPLKTVDIDVSVPLEVAKGIKRTIAVYQHSNIKFISLASQGNNKNAKTIYDEARKFIVDDLIFQQLAKMSHLLANYSGSKDNGNIKTKIDWLKIHIKDEHDPKGHLNTLAQLCSPCYDNNNILPLQRLIETNCCVNNLIKEIVILNN